MRNINYTPLYRSSIGFDQLTALLDSTTATESVSSGFPPYDIEHLDRDQFKITMALAGFKEDDLHIEVEKNILIIKGRKDKEVAKEYLYHGIAVRNFERRFELAEYIKVTDATLTDGLLEIHLLKKIPEEMKPKSIPINGIETGNLLGDEIDKAA